VYCIKTAGTIKRRGEASTIILSDDQMGQVRMAKNASDRKEAECPGEDEQALYAASDDRMRGSRRFFFPLF
jgi:hypothetical protein